MDAGKNPVKTRFPVARPAGMNQRKTFYFQEIVCLARDSKNL